MLLGRALRKAGRLDDVVIATKAGANFSSGTTTADFCTSYIRQAVDASLTRLGRDRIDLYQLHNPPLQVIEHGEVFGALDDLVQSGKILHYGASIHTVEEGLACLRHHRVETLQVAYNLFQFVDEERSMSRIFPPAVQAGVGIIAREPLAAGLLSGRHRRRAAYGPGDLRAEWSSARQDLYVALADSVRYLQSDEVTLAQAALRFVIDTDGVSTTIVGAKTPSQVEENIRTLSTPPFAVLAAGEDSGGD